MDFKKTLLSIVMFGVLAVSPVNAEVWSPWADLANFKPDQAGLIAVRTSRGHAPKDYSVQKIAEGEGNAVNVDEYVVRIDNLPSGWNRSELYRHVRVNLNDFLDQGVAKFKPHSDGDKTDWEADTEARLGTIMIFEINVLGLGWDNAAVVVSRSGNSSWVFSPIDDGFTGDFGTHPVAGNRQFGVRESGGSLEFFTRGFDRVYPTHVSVKEGDAFQGADQLWKSFQTKLKSYVESKGGSATILVPSVPGGNDPDSKPQYGIVCADPAIDLQC